MVGMGTTLSLRAPDVSQEHRPAYRGAMSLAPMRASEASFRASASPGMRAQRAPESSRGRSQAPAVPLASVQKRLLPAAGEAPFGVGHDAVIRCHRKKRRMPRDFADPEERQAFLEGELRPRRESDVRGRRHRC